MESLAAVVAFLFITAILSGPIALAVAHRKVHTNKGLLVRRSIVTLFALWGTLNGVQFVLSNIPILARLIGIMSVVTSAFAFKREFGRKTSAHNEEEPPTEPVD